MTQYYAFYKDFGTYWMAVIVAKDGDSTTGEVVDARTALTEAELKPFVQSWLGEIGPPIYEAPKAH